MEASVLTALAALAGAAIGSFTTFLASWFQQRAQRREQRLTHYQLRRQELYKEFIDQAAPLYIDALQSEKPDISSLMRLYAEISRMRVLSSEAVVASAEQIVKQIIDTYLEPNKTFPQLREMVETGLLDPLRNFSESCRAESAGLEFGPPD